MKTEYNGMTTFIFDFEEKDIVAITDSQWELAMIAIDWEVDHRMLSVLVETFSMDMISDFLCYHWIWWNLWSWLDMTADYNESVVNLVWGLVSEYI